MSNPTLTDLLTVPTQAQQLANALALLQSGTPSFPTTDYGPTSPELALLNVDAAALADLGQLVPKIIALVLVKYATGDSLRFVAKQWYEIDYNPALPTQGTIYFTVANSAGPYTIAVNQLQVTDGVNVYTNTAGGTLSSAAPVSLAFEALTAGSLGNSPANGTITQMLTPLPGVTCSNHGGPFSAVTHLGNPLATGTVTPTGATPTPANYIVRFGTGGEPNPGTASWGYSTDGGSSYTPAGNVVSVTVAGTTITIAAGAPTPSFYAGDMYSFSTPATWVTRLGSDVESDPSLTQRCLARWPSLSAIPTLDVYTLWAVTAGAGQVTQVKPVTASAATSATVNVYIAGTGAAVPTGTLNVVQAYISARAPVGAVPVVNNATVTPLTITGTATYKASNGDPSSARNVAINAYVQGGGFGATVELAEIIALGINPSDPTNGAVNITGVQINAVTADYVLGATAVASCVNNIVWTAV